MADESDDDSKALARRTPTADDIGSKLLEFLTKYMAEGGTRQVMRVELKCISDSFRTEPLETWTRESEPELFGKLSHTEAMSQKILSLMEDHADAAGETCVFEIKLRGYDHQTYKRQYRIMPSRRVNDERGMLLPNETPTGTGLLALMMRHNTTMMQHVENNNKQTAALQQGAVDSILRVLQETREENATLRTERATHLRELEQARSEEAERDLRYAAQEAADKRKAVMVDKFAMLLPVLAQAIAGKLTKGKADAKAGPHIKTPLEENLLKFMSTMTDQQIGMIKGLLDFEQGILLQSAIDAAEQGGSALLATLINDFIKSLRAPQLTAMMEKISPEQRMMLLEIMKLARAASATATTEQPASEPA